MPERIDIIDDGSLDNNKDKLPKRATIFSKFLLSLLKREEFPLDESTKKMLIGDIGCGIGEEIPFLLQELQSNFPDLKTHILAVDPSKESTDTLKDLLFFLDVPEKLVTVVTKTGSDPEVFNAAKTDEGEKYDLFLFRNPDLHAVGSWDKTFQNVVNNLSEEGQMVFTCANDHEIENITNILKPYNFELKVYDVGQKQLTHSTQPETYWITAKRKKK